MLNWVKKIALNVSYIVCRTMSSSKLSDLFFMWYTKPVGDIDLTHKKLLLFVSIVTFNPSNKRAKVSEQFPSTQWH